MFKNDVINWQHVLTVLLLRGEIRLKTGDIYNLRWACVHCGLLLGIMFKH